MPRAFVRACERVCAHILFLSDFLDFAIATGVIAGN